MNERLWLIHLFCCRGITEIDQSKSVANYCELATVFGRSTVADVVKSLKLWSIWENHRRFCGGWHKLNDSAACRGATEEGRYR